MCPDIPAVVFFFLKTDLIRAFHAGALPSFAECKQLTVFMCNNNQFSGAYSRVSTDRSVVPDIPAVTFFSLFYSLFKFQRWALGLVWCKQEAAALIWTA